ncbi:MAG: hypothetical protein ACK493_09375 [Planctomycetota bacterium]|jgi:hypothetical protein
MKIHSSLAFIIFVLSLLQSSLTAGFIPVKNASFEANTDLPYHNAHNYWIDDWQIVSSSGLSYIGGTHTFVGQSLLTPPATDGVNVAFQNDKGYLLQILDRTFQRGDNLELKVDIGWRLDVPDLPNYSIQIMAGNTILASYSEQSILVHGGWGTAVANYTFNEDQAGLIGEQLKIKLETRRDWRQINYDNVRLELTAVPEPNAVAGLLFIFSVGLAVRRTRVRLA